MKKLGNFPKENHERKQLEEIAHLYFSSPSPKTEAPKKQVKSERSAETFSPFPRALFVQCVAGQPERGLSTWFLFNLAVMLKILNGPVLVIGSPRLYENRFRFGFRPDRERLRVDQGLQIPSGSFGPMGVCLLDGRVLWRGDRREGQVPTVDPLAGKQVAFRYILSDEVRPGRVFGSLPRLKVFFVTPATTTPTLLDREMGEDDRFASDPGHAGIVVAGAGCAEEGDALYNYWRDRIEERCDLEVAVENFGMLPSEAGAGSPSAAGPSGNPGDASLRNRGRVPGDPFREERMPGVGILEDPAGAQTRFCHATAALIRDKRSELLPAA